MTSFILNSTEVTSPEKRSQRRQLRLRRKQLSSKMTWGISMIDTSVISILTFFLILGDLEAVTVVSHHSDDEYVLEHEVLRKNALIEAKKLEIHPGKRILRAAPLLAK